jgi:lipoprotein YgeR
MPIYATPLRSALLLLTLLLGACGTVSNGSQYEVKAGDTLYSIARSNGRSVAELKKINQLNDTNIQVGQILKIAPASAGSAPTKPAKPAPAPAARPTPPASAPRPPAITLAWPNKGPVLQGYNGKSNKGIDIGGDAGEAVYAAASGKVVYVGNGIRSYGNLLIIKHDKDYLTTYAHNQRILPKEGEMVQQGQRVADMGKSGSDRVKLHFELRFKGQAINPVPFLP